MAISTQSPKKSSATKRTGNHKVNPPAVETYIEGIEFPTDKSALVELAAENGAPDDVMEILNKFSDQEYGSVMDIAREVARIDENPRGSRSSKPKDTDKEKNEEKATHANGKAQRSPSGKENTPKRASK